MMRYLLFYLFLLAFPFMMKAQYDWQWTPLADMPEAVANHAVDSWFDGSDYHVYSFSGIDSTLSRTGIHLKSFHYDVSNDMWTTLPDVPDTLGKIAAGVSRVGDTLYVVGGYHVFDGPPFELSSNRIHRWNASEGLWMDNGTDLPLHIDDQVQAVWRDSLIYSVTGWSDTGNVPDVQIYDPSQDSWVNGTPTPNSGLYTSFGASGVIIEDTIYYNGGAFGNTFAPSGRLRVGVIDPDDPSLIDWSQRGLNPGEYGYRMGAIKVSEVAFWVGGGENTYNYDGIAYDNSGGVEPLSRILAYDTQEQTWDEGLDQEVAIMDLRGIAPIGDESFVVCGGIGSGQVVSKKTYRLDYLGPVSVPERPRAGFQLIPNIISRPDGQIRVINHNPVPFRLFVHDLSGRMLGQIDIKEDERILSLSELHINRAGHYLLRRAGQGLSSGISLIVQ